MDSPSNDTPAPPIPLLFRSNKKRKANYRQRPEDEDRATSPRQAAIITEPPNADKAGEQKGSSHSPGNSAVHPAEDEEDSSIAEALRLRTARKARHNGVGFKAVGSQVSRADGHWTANEERSIVLSGQDESSADAGAGGMTERFAPQTGLVGEVVNKHMMEYIESKLSSRAGPPVKDNPSDRGSPSRAASNLTTAPTSSAQAPDIATSARHGKLMEIDLGDEVRAKNIAMTERARRRLQAGSELSSVSPGHGSGLDVEDDAEGSGQPRKKARLGRDGKPWRPRNRRASEDLARDKLVEDFLHENRLDVYEMPNATAQPTSQDGTAEDDADDRLAEEFRREFMDAMALRRQQAAQHRKKPAPKGKQTEEILRGPKLGGSRSSRAAMRDLLLQQEKDKKAARR